MLYHKFGLIFCDYHGILCTITNEKFYKKGSGGIAKSPYSVIFKKN